VNVFRKGNRLPAISTVRSSQLPVSDGSKFIGMMSKPELERATPDVLEIRQLIKHAEFPHVHSDHTLDVALHRMGSNRVQELPVVSRRDVHRLEGLIALHDVLRLYGFDQSKWPPG